MRKTLFSMCALALSITTSAQITETPAGKLIDNMYRSSESWIQKSWTGTARGRYEGLVSKIVVGDDNCLYIYNPLSGLDSNTWLKLEKVSEGKYKAVLPQAIHKDDNGDDDDDESGSTERTLYLNRLQTIGKKKYEVVPKDKNFMEYSWDGKTLKMLGAESDGVILGMTYNNKWEERYGDWSVTIQYFDNSLITPPTTPLNGGKSLHDVLSNLGSFSIAFWINAEKPTKAIGLFSLTNNKGFWSYIDLFMEPGNSTQTNGRFKLHLSNGTENGWVDKVIPETLGKWVHLVFRYDATTGKVTIFRNGAEVHSQEFKTLGGIACPNLGTLVIGTLPFQTTPPLTTGAGAQGWAGFYKGQLDQFYFFNEPINDVQIKTLASEK